MTRQLALKVKAEAAPKLTERQAKALEILRDVGREGIGPASLGAWMHDWSGKHAVEGTCHYCAATGTELLRALRKKGLARQRRPRGEPAYWQATDLPAERPSAMMPDDEAIF